MMSRIAWLPAGLLAAASIGNAANVSPLAARGYAVLPDPQRVELGERDFRFGADWRIETSGVAATDIAVESLQEELEARYHVALAGRSKPLRLVVAPRSVAVGGALDRDRDALAREAYRISLASNGIEIAANAPPGLFYGVQTLVQLIRPQGGSLSLPEGHITDWPDLEARFLYWDDAHHLERFDDLKRALRTAAFFKANGFVIKLEGHFQFKSAPALVEPQALSPAQLQELTDYGLRRHIQLIPYLDGPGHIAFILKHPEYARLRSFPESDYELCVTNEDSYKLMFGMFQDLLDANKGVKYFFLSTDEAYYVGLADNAQCHETGAAKEAGSVGKLLARFTTRTADYLHDRGRAVLFLGEYPMKPEDIPAVPSYMINGETYGPLFDPAFKKHGIRSMFYTSTEGEEKLFPAYFSRGAGGRGGSGSGRVPGTFQRVSFDPAREQADVMGSINAGWADMGLHPETFWLGYAAATGTAWHPGSPDPRETMNTFYTLFYGPGAIDMNRVYQLMSYQAQSWNETWDTAASPARKPIFGSSYEIHHPAQPARDQAIPLPPAPSGDDLSVASNWAQENARRLQIAATALPENDELFALLYQNLQFLEEMSRVASRLQAAHAPAQPRQAQPAPRTPALSPAEQAVDAVDQALNMVRRMRDERNQVLREVTAAWQESWLPRVAEANGRRYVHELDDVKDHLPDRTIDMSYLVYRELLLPMDDWYGQVQAARNRYAEANHLPPRHEKLEWKDLGWQPGQ